MLKSQGKTASVIALLALADAVFKFLILQHPEPSFVVGNIFQISLYRNPGIAFSLPVPHIVIIPLTLIICAALALYIRKEQDTRLRVCAFSALLCALGNLIDRIIHNFTTDYLIFFQISAINISDILILAGILGLIWYAKPAQR